MILSYDEPVWRPPSEADNLIFQATLGCGFNGCAFCSMYKTKHYSPRPKADLFAEIARVARFLPETKRVFLADGDAYGLSFERLAAICDRLVAAFPQLARISAYATPFNILDKSVEEIQALKARKLSLVYLGIETGSDALLTRVGKGPVHAVEEALARASRAGLKVSATVIAGLGGKALWREHVEATAALINRVPPPYLSVLQLGLEPQAAERFRERFEGAFEPQDDAAILVELEHLLEGIDPPRPVIFRSNHASNALALAGTLPKDKNRLLAEIRAAQDGKLRLRPDWLRGM